jgi:release factor glutamine methyltransferase
VTDSLYDELLQRLEADLVVLPDKPDETPRATLHCLWGVAAGTPLAISETLTFALPPLDDTQRLHLRDLVARRLVGVPLAHITGRQDFMGIVLRTSPAALVPRRETELLTRAAASKLSALESPSPMVVDLCTGCGNVALALALHAPQARVWGGDLCAEAVALARTNASLVGRPEVDFRIGDLAEPFATPEFLGQVDVVTCNPPYISSGKVEAMHHEISAHEPRVAFDGGPFGINVLLRLLTEAPRLLKQGGWLLFEVGLGQGDALHKRLARLPEFSTIEAVRDANGDIRALAARRSD